MIAFLSAVTVLALMLFGSVVLFVLWHEAADIMQPWWRRRKKLLQSRAQLRIIK